MRVVGIGIGIRIGSGIGIGTGIGIGSNVGLAPGDAVADRRSGRGGAGLRRGLGQKTGTGIRCPGGEDGWRDRKRKRKRKRGRKREWEAGLGWRVVAVVGMMARMTARSESQSQKLAFDCQGQKPVFEKLDTKRPCPVEKSQNENRIAHHLFTN